MKNHTHIGRLFNLDKSNKMNKFSLLLIASSSALKIETSWNNKPWESAYKWDQSTVEKIYKVADSNSHFRDYTQRDDAWNDAEYNQSDEV